MPLINVNNTTNPQNSVAPAPNFVTPPSNYSANTAPSDNGSIIPTVKEYTAPSEPVIEPQADIKASLDGKLSNIPDLETETAQSLPPLPSDVPDLSNLQNQTVQQDVLAAVPEVSPIQNTNLTNETLEVNVPQPKTVADITEPVVELTPVIETQPEPGQVETKADLANGTRHLELPEILDIAIKRGASDIHLTTGYRTVIRVDGKLEIASSAILDSTIVNQYVLDLLKTRPEIQVNTIKEVDLTHAWNGRRFRVNIFKQMGNFSITLRVIPEKILTISELGMPEGINQFANFPNGLVLVTGPTGSGKSTTIAAILNQINLTMPKHIVTLEDPIEFVFPKGMGLVDQREFGIDFSSWDNALRSVLRQDPDVVLVGEMRDLETVEAALQIAETGHLVFATLHTNGASETINRVIDIFDSQKQDQIRIQLSSVLRAVISQKLVPLPSGGRKPAVEILLSTPSVRNAVRDKKTFQIDNIIQTSSDMGMISMSKSLVAMVKKGEISKEQAKSLSVNPNEIDILLEQS